MNDNEYIETLTDIDEWDDLPPIPHDVTATGYMAMHARLRSICGPAIEFDCADCGEGAYEWSLSETEREVFDPEIRCFWSASLTDYRPRCRVCHAWYDKMLRWVRSEVCRLRTR